MNISILSVFKELYTPFLQTSLINRAQQRGIVHIDVDTLFSFVKPKERIDAPTVGPGAGMLIRPEVVEKAIETKQRTYGKAFKIFFSPHGKKLNQRLLKNIVNKAQEMGHIMLLPARYEGMDTRAEEYYADEIISVGDFVLMGGDIPAMMFLEGLLRLIPDVVGKPESVEEESFTGPFVDYPHYTSPIEWKGMKVPDVLKSGDHAKIHAWRMNQAAQRTVMGHFDWLRSSHMTDEQKSLASAYIPPHYVALMHADVLIGEEKNVGTTSVTSIDLHDIARSAKTYGVNNFFIVTPLIDQQKIVQRLLDFWLTEGIEYNKQRYEAIKQVRIASQLDEVISQIEQFEGKKPVLVATSAREVKHSNIISCYDQAKVWPLNKPVLFLFGTGKGLSPAVIERCDFMLLPAHGFSDFNHLSVRSAAAVILDRWLGINEQYV